MYPGFPTSKAKVNLHVSFSNINHIRFYIDLSWIFSTCIGLLLFLVEIGIIFYVKFEAVKFRPAAYLTTAMLSKCSI